jgi:hypothetical protein
MCTTEEPPGSAPECNSEDRPAAVGPEELHVDRSPGECATGPEAAADATAASFPRGKDSTMEPVIADFADGAGATEESVGAGVGVVIGAVVTPDGVALASWPSPAVGAVLFGIPAARPLSAVFETESPVAEFAAALSASALFKGFEDVDVLFRFGRDGDTGKWFLIALETSDVDVSGARCSREAAFELPRDPATGLFAKSIISSGFVGDGNPCASSSFEGAGSFVGACVFAITSVSALGA